MQYVDCHRAIADANADAISSVEIHSPAAADPISIAPCSGHPPAPPSLLAALPADVRLRLIAFFDAPTMCRVAGVNREWYNCASSDRVWRRLCDERWRDKCRHPDIYTVCARFPRRHLLYGSLAELRLIEQSRYFAESETAFAPSYVPSPPLSPAGSEPLMVNSWKQAYEYAEWDSRCAMLTETELLRMRWILIRADDANSMPVLATFEVFGDRRSVVMFPWQVKPWRWIGYWLRGQQCIQVAERAPLRLSLDAKTWAWRMENAKTIAIQTMLPTDATYAELCAFAKSQFRSNCKD
jgi:hypothetical protein